MSKKKEIVFAEDMTDEMMNRAIMSERLPSTTHKTRGNQISALPHLLGLRLKKNMESHGTVLLVPTSEERYTRNPNVHLL